MIFVAVVVGAAIGAPLRYLVDRWVTARTIGTGSVSEVPWGLFAVNVLGTLIAAVAFAATSPGAMRTFVIVGFAGAFTTFSGFSWDATRLWSVRRSAFWTTVIAMPLACVVVFVAVTQVLR